MAVEQTGKKIKKKLIYCVTKDEPIQFFQMDNKVPIIVRAVVLWFFCGSLD